MDFKNKKVLVIGAGISGRSAIEVLLPRGAEVSVCDKKDREELLHCIPENLASRIKIFDFYPEVRKGDFDLLVLSPGVKLDIPPVIQAINLKIPVIGEVELAYLIKSPQTEIYAITGTNGKTTTTTLLHEILTAAGKPSIAGGNIGVALTSLVGKKPTGIISAEISSFQLETINTFRPHICGLLNITPDHMDRHKTMENYIETKAKIFSNQKAEDFAVFNYEDLTVRELSSQCPGQVIFFSTERELESGAFIKDQTIKIRLDNQEQSICRLDETLLRGKHNQENILCAVAMASAAKIEPEYIAATLKAFAGVRHRMEEVMTVGGVLYINDSKGTNPESSIKAIECFDNPIVLIAGGRNKGSKFDFLAKSVKSRVKDLILLGEAKDEIKTSVMTAGFKNIHEVEDLPEAVVKASKLAEKGDVVLLSPACASWDMFDNYEQRGDMFCDIVHTLIDIEK
ncbi:MAG: UDP-N-acetylmuramoyl-L-alanine--D-glutamate ligase [Syntrophomonadaceae bacterium]|nr:UDP-N-acetylmuramoyl-L-alanine--D-glutamate ligase [Syntrophomonadaceae bacterium]